MTTLSPASSETRERTYRRSHPWIRFEINLADAPARLWLALGEARSKCDHLAGVPLKPAVASRLHAIYLAKGVHATSAIEGNTLTEHQVLDRIDGKKVVPESQKYLEQEIDNLLAVTNEILAAVERQGPMPIYPNELMDYNRKILNKLEVGEHVEPGEYRKCAVGVADYPAPNWRDCDYLIERYCRWLNNADFHPPEKDDAIVSGIIKAIVAHVYFAWIHPFGDGNGRTARLLEVRFLMEAGVPSAAIHLLSNHYNQTRTEYYRKLSEASKNGGDLTNFLLYAARGFVDQLRMQLSAVKAQQWGVAWQNFVYELFGEEKTKADKRQIMLLLALSGTDDPVPLSKVKHLTPKLAETYAGKTGKTLTRDLNSLGKLNLVERSKQGVRARKELILAFLPRSRKGDFEEHIHVGKRMREEEGRLQLELLSLLDEPSSVHREAMRN